MTNNFMKKIILFPHILKHSFKLNKAFEHAGSRDYTAALRVMDEIEKQYKLKPSGEHLLLKAHCLYRLEKDAESIATFEEAWEVCKDNQRMNSDEEKYINTYIHSHFGQEMLGLSDSDREAATFSRKNIRKRYLDQFGTKVRAQAEN